MDEILINLLYIVFSLTFSTSLILIIIGATNKHTHISYIIGSSFGLIMSLILVIALFLFGLFKI